MTALTSFFRERVFGPDRTVMLAAALPASAAGQAAQRKDPRAGRPGPGGGAASAAGRRPVSMITKRAQKKASRSFRTNCSVATVHSAGKQPRMISQILAALGL